MRGDRQRNGVGAAERWCRLTLRGLAVAFAVAGTLFFLFPDATVAGMNAAGARLGNFTPAPPSALRFWLSLATGYMALVTALAWMAQRDLRRHRNLVALLVLGKAVTSLSALGFYLFVADAFVYLVNFVVDGGITLAALAVWMVIPSLDVPGESAAADEGSGPRKPAPVVDALLEAMVPAGGPFAESAQHKTVAADTEAFVSGLGPLAAGALRLGLRLLEVSPFLLPPLRLRRFSQLPLDERVRLLEAGERSRWVVRRESVRVLKLLVMMQFYSRPEIEARLGYPAPLERVARLREAS